MASVTTSTPTLTSTPTPTPTSTSTTPGPAPAVAPAPAALPAKNSKLIEGPQNISFNAPSVLAGGLLTATAIVIRLLPSTPVTASTFTNWLQDLTITAYDQNIQALPDPTVISPGTSEWGLGSAAVSSSTKLWTPTLPPFLVNVSPGPNANSPPVLASSIFQHFSWDYANPNVLIPTLKSVATAIILVNIDPKAPTPYPEYPNSTSYDVRLSMSRGSPTATILPDPPIEWNIVSQTVSYPDLSAFPLWRVEYFGINELFPTDPSMYVLLPQPLPTTPASSLVALRTDGTPPVFDDLVTAVNPVVQAYNLGGSTLGSLATPLTADQCKNIASEIIYNPALQHLPTPIPPFPNDQKDPPSYLEDLYTEPNSTADGIRKQFEGNLMAYHATNNSAAQKLAPFIFAASAAAYAEYQTTQSQTASWTFPLLSSSGPSATVTLSGSGAALNPSFVVPAAYFYALCADYPATSDAKHRYQAVLTTTPESIYKKLQAAQAKGILKNTQSPITTAGGTTPVDDIQAVLRISALSANFVLGSDPVLNLTGPVATLVDGWLSSHQGSLAGPSPFWTPAVFGDTDYLNMIMLVITKTPSLPPAPPDPLNFLNKIKNTPLVPLPQGSTLPYRVIKTASDLPLITNSEWLAFFQDLLLHDYAALPAWIGPGNAQQQTKAFTIWLQTLFSVGFSPTSFTAPTGGNIGSLGSGFSADVLANFFSEYATMYPPGLTFAVALVDSQISAILSMPSFSDPTLKQWIKNALTTISNLYLMTAIKSPAINQGLQFSYMEALYARGFTTQESVALLSTDQFTSALTGTVAYHAAGAIYTLATTPPVNLPPVQPEPGNGFQSCNPGTLVNCIPPLNLSPFGTISYLHDVIQLSLGSSTLGDAVSARRGPVGTVLTATEANMTTEILVVDLVNESLEALGSNSGVSHGMVYNTADTSLAGFDFEGPDAISANTVLAAIPQYSSPATAVASPGIYDTLKSNYTSLHLPYSQGLDVCRSYLCHLGTSRLDTMRHFRQYITEFPLDSALEPTDFIKHQWRLPVRLELALEYLQISTDEYNTLWSTTLTPVRIGQLYGVDISNNKSPFVGLVTVSGFLLSTGLTYCEFLDLWKSGIVAFSRQNGGLETAIALEDKSQSGFPECPPCCLDSLGIYFPTQEPINSLGMMAVFIRLWRKLQLRCRKHLSMQCLADVCTVLNLFTVGKTVDINPDFVRQLASLLMLLELFKLPLTGGHSNPAATGADRTKLLSIWAGPTANPTTRAWAIKELLSCISTHSQKSYKCAERGPEFAKILAENLDQLSSLAGFSASKPWFSSPTCTIRFAEVLAKIYASNFTVGELLFLFTTIDHLDGDDPFPLGGHNEALDNPFDLPDDSPYNLAALRRKLLEVEICDDDLEKLDWYSVESVIRDAGLRSSPGGGSDPLLYMAQHFFPDLLETYGYHVGPDQRRFTTALSPSSTSPAMWNSPRCGPFHYSYDLSTQNEVTNAKDSNQNATQTPHSGQLWAQLPLCDGEVLKQLRDLRQLNLPEILAVQDIYFAPRMALVPLAPLFSNFSQAMRYLITERSEHERFKFFKKEVSKFHRRCEIIAEHLAHHVRSAACADGEQEECPDRDVAWKILTSLIADENSAATPWEDDSGLPPTQFAADPKFSGGAFAALLGLIGTGLQGQYETGSVLKWLEMRGGLSAFGFAEDKWNVPVPTIIPALDLVPSANENESIRFKNGLIIYGDESKDLGGAQPFKATWTGSLIIAGAGHYRFGAGRPVPEEEMPQFCPENRWLVTLGRGQKTWTVLNNCWGETPAPAHVSHPVSLQQGVYSLTVRFEQIIRIEQKSADSDDRHHAKTGFQLKYEGPDTKSCPMVVPFSRLIRDAKSGPFMLADQQDSQTKSSNLIIANTVSQYLQSQYVSTLRDIRRTYQRAFKAVLFAHRFNLSARKVHCDYQSELGYILDSGDRFAGTSYYIPPGGTAFRSHHANFNFNFLPVMDDYMPPADSRASPSPQRQQAMFDWFERMFDYTRLREQVERLRKRPIWLLFQDVATQKPNTLDQYVRYLGIDLNLSELALQYFNSPLYSVVATDLLDERWAVRLWRVRGWICDLTARFYSHLLEKILPALWAADDPTAIIGSSSGNANLTYFVQHGSVSKKFPKLVKGIKRLDDGLRLRAREALLAYLCGMNRVATPLTSSGFVSKPSELSDLLLQDVEARISQKCSRVDDAIFSVQTLVQRARMGLESSLQVTPGFLKSWEDRYSSFEKWVAWKRRIMYTENWIQWEELDKLNNSEGPSFLKEELRQMTSTIVEPGRPMWWAGDNYPHDRLIEPIQINELVKYGLEQGSTSNFEGLSLIGTPERDARPSLLAAGLVFQTTATSSGPSNSTVSATLTTKKAVPKFHVADATGLGTLEAIPLWVEAAVRLGTQFIRVAAAGAPPAFSFTSLKPDEKACCSSCGLAHEAVVDEYYFWLQDSKYFDDSMAQQNADVGSTSALDPNTDWENTTDPTKIPALLFWPSKLLLHLAWTRVHMGRLDPPRRSDQGISYDASSSTPLLQLTGREMDSLNFSAFGASTGPGQGSETPTFTGFRYDVANDSVVLVPQAVPDVQPAPTQPLSMASFPKFAYFQPGKPLVPVSSLGVALAMASASRYNCKFEVALKWCQLMFDPLSRDNTWAQCPQTNNTLAATHVHASGERSDSFSTIDSKTVLTLAFSPRSGDSNNLDMNPYSNSDLPCCPSAPVSGPVAHCRAVSLEYLRILEQWGDSLLHQNSAEASHQALIIFNAMSQILGPRPTEVHAHDKVASSRTIAKFVSSPPPLNPELLKLYDVVKDRQAMIRETESSRRLHGGLKKIRLSPRDGHFGWDKMNDALDCGIENCFARCQPYRFSALLPKALDSMSMVKGLGAALLSAFEKGDAEYMAAIRSAQDRKILDLGLQTAQNTWRAADWDVQALDESMQNALTRLHYYQGLIQNGLNSGETGYQFAAENAMQSQNASNVAEGEAQAANIIPDLAFGVAGLGPYESTTIPIGQKLANAASSAARIMSMIAQMSSSNGSLQLTQAGWTRRAQEWQNTVNLIDIEIQQIKRQTLAAWRRRDSALLDLNNHQQQMDHTAEIQDYMRDKLSKHELYLFLQQETAALYRQAYNLAVQIARDAEEAFKFERAESRHFLANLKWDSLHEGLMAGERLEMALRSMERAYMQVNCREYEISKNLSAKLQFPDAFLKLKCCGSCEIDIPEWMFDLDYPGHYMRRIKSLTLSIACVAGPYTSINCRLQLLSSSIRVKPLLSAEEECCCNHENDEMCRTCTDPYVVRHFGATEAIATSDGQDDSGLFQLDFRDERYLPFEYRGATSRWRIELPPENNQFDPTTLTDVVLHLNYTSREGGHQLRAKANASAQRHLPADGVRFFDIRHDFPDAWRVFQMDANDPKNQHHNKARDWPLRFSRAMFPFLVGQRAVVVRRLHLFISTAGACQRRKHIRVSIKPAGERCRCEEEEFVCVVVDDACPGTYYGRVEAEFGPIEGCQWWEFGRLRFESGDEEDERGEGVRGVREAYLLVEWEAFPGGCEEARDGRLGMGYGGW